MMTAILFVMGLSLLVGGADLLVRGAAAASRIVGLPPLVVGLTVVAFGTSAPELAVSASASLRGDPNLALGNVVGSNIFNVLLILGASALVAPLLVAREVVRWQVPLMVGISLLVWALLSDGSLSRLEGAGLLLGIVAYTAYLLWDGLRRGEGGDDAPGGRETVEDGWGIGKNLLLAGAGLGLLVLGSRWLVTAARTLALELGISELVVGLTVVAAGTSLPELATSIVASGRGERDIAVGNIVGSNVFNLLAILGTAAVLAPGGIPVAPAALTFDVPVMVAVAVACLPIFFTGHRIDRWEGALFLLYYVAYVVYLVLDTSGHELLPEFRQAMAGFVLPLTGVTLGVLAWRGWRRSG